MEPPKESNSKFGDTIANLFPGEFAIVMATGIVSISAYFLDMPAVAWPLVFVNIVAYAVLVVLLFLRLLRFFPRVVADLGDHVRGPGFFTIVAGTCVLGSQLIIVCGQFQVAAVLWFAGVTLWVLIMYAFFTAITIKESKPELVKGINGAWLLAAVATQSISVLGTLLAAAFRGLPRAVVVLHALHVPDRMYAVFASDHADILSVYVPRSNKRFADAALLDKYGGGRHNDTRRPPD